MKSSIWHPNSNQRYWVKSQKETSRLIQMIWNAASEPERKTADFICLLTTLGWCTNPFDSTRRRDKAMAKYLRAADRSLKSIVAAAHRHWPRLNSKALHNRMKNPTGITNFLGFYIRGVRPFIGKHHKVLHQAFKLAVSPDSDPINKVERIAALLFSLPQIPSKLSSVSPLNAFSPVLACLDSKSHFPVINQKVDRALTHHGFSFSAHGVGQFASLIGHGGIRDNKHLDVWAQRAKFIKHGKVARVDNPAHRREEKALEDRLQEKALSHLSAKKKTINLRHNLMMRTLNKVLRSHKHIALESYYDACVRNYRGKRDLLIEAKSTNGRFELRTAIGQLFDYRMRYLKDHPRRTLDLAVLLPNKPKGDILDLLDYLKITTLWLDNGAVHGQPVPKDAFWLAEH